MRRILLGRTAKKNIATVESTQQTISGGHGPEKRAVMMVGKLGVDVLHDPLINKGTGFQLAERERLRIRGLVPPLVLPLEDQEEKLMIRYRDLETDLERHVFLQDLRDRNETLYFRILMNHIREMAPVIYTPTVGAACLRFGSLFRRARGMYFSREDRGHMHSMVYNWPGHEVDVVVVTDGSRILGLGDLGVNGMGIPIGKLALYVAAAGIHPNRVLPVMIDVGTDNQELLNDPHYLGLRRPRLRGQEYFDVVDEFIGAITHRFPHALIQFEDFETRSAAPILQKYKDHVLCFNDDIQGTGAVALAGLLSALRMQGKSPADLCNQRVVCVGAGSAGIGVVQSVLSGMVHEGMVEDMAYSRFYLVDQHGLIGLSRQGMLRNQISFARQDLPDAMPLEEVIRQVKPTILLGLSGAAGSFTEPAVREMAKHVERPVIFPLSNPTAMAECTAEQAIEWTDGRAIIASGSPFAPVSYNGRTHHIGQSNNMFIFPGIGLGVTVSRSKLVTDEMFYTAAKTLANCLTNDELERGLTYPDISRIRDVSKAIATEVCKLAHDEKLARAEPPRSSMHLGSLIDKAMFEPHYSELVPL